MNKVRHKLSISGGKDSAILSIYLKQKYPLTFFRLLLYGKKTNALREELALASSDQ